MDGKNELSLTRTSRKTAERWERSAWRMARGAKRKAESAKRMAHGAWRGGRGEWRGERDAWGENFYALIIKTQGKKYGRITLGL